MESGENFDQRAYIDALAARDQPVWRNLGPGGGVFVGEVPP